MKNSEFKNKKVPLRKLISLALVLVLGMSVLMPVYAEEQKTEHKQFEEKLEAELGNAVYNDALYKLIKKCIGTLEEKELILSDNGYNPLMELFTLRDEVTASVNSLKDALESAGLVDSINRDNPIEILDEIGRQFLEKISDNSDLVNELKINAEQFYALFDNLLTQMLNGIIASCEQKPAGQFTWNNAEGGYSGTAQNICDRIQELIAIIDDYIDLQDAAKKMIEGQKAGEEQQGADGKKKDDEQEMTNEQKMASLKNEIEALKPLLAQSFFSEDNTTVKLAIAELKTRRDVLELQKAQNDALEEMKGQLEDKMSEIDETIDQNLAAVNRKLLFGYIGLAVGAVSLIVGIIAMACGLRKQSDVTVDLSDTASRDDVKMLNAQNEKLRQENSLSEKRIDQLQDNIRLLQQEVEDLRRAPASVAAVQPELKPEPKPVSQSAPLIGSYALQYQIINPANSYLVPSAKGKYELYADNTLTLGKNEKGKLNAMSSWSGSGLLYLFDAVVDKKEYSLEKAKNLSGTYQIVDVDIPAIVRSSSNPGQYMLEKKGKVILREV